MWTQNIKIKRTHLFVLFVKIKRTHMKVTVYLPCILLVTQIKKQGCFNGVMSRISISHLDMNMNLHNVHDRHLVS